MRGVVKSEFPVGGMCGPFIYAIGRQNASVAKRGLAIAGGARSIGGIVANGE
jgi:hypothetical protein